MNDILRWLDFWAEPRLFRFRTNYLRIRPIQTVLGLPTFARTKKVRVNVHINTRQLSSPYKFTCSGALGLVQEEFFPSRFYDVYIGFWVAAPVSLYLNPRGLGLPAWHSIKSPHDTLIEVYLVQGTGKIYYNRDERVLILHANPIWVSKDESRWGGPLA
jgi:hypothetical protein